MTALDLFNHLLNFAAPAFFVALVLGLVTRLFGRGRAGAAGLWAQGAIVFLAGLIVLAAGLAYFGRDGMMATYGALVVACGSVQWWLRFRP